MTSTAPRLDSRSTVLLLLCAAALAACERPRAAPDQARLGVKELCAALLKGDPAAAAKPLDIAPRTVPELLRRYKGEKDEPFSEIPPENILQALPKDQGPIASCRPGGFGVKDGELIKEMVLGYARSELTVTLRYQRADWPKLRFFKVGVPEPQATAAAQPRSTTEALDAYSDWLKLEARFLKALKTKDPYEWMAVETEAAALTNKTFQLRLDLDEAARQPSESLAQRPAYLAQAKAYAESLDRCAAQLNDMSGRMRKRLAEHQPYPDQALIADLTKYRALKLVLLLQTTALRKAR